MPSCRRPPRALALLFALLAPGAGCATGTTALWRAGASRAGLEDVERGMPRASSEVALHYKEGFGRFEETESQRLFACNTTTVMRKAFLLEESPPPAPERDHEVLAHVTTEEFPRDEERSRIESDQFGSVFGIGTAPMELFEVRLDPAWRAAAEERLRYYAAQLGADAVVDVFATGEAEFHMWEGGAISFDNRSTSSPIYIDGKLLDFRLRDVRLHGTAVRYED